MNKEFLLSGNLLFFLLLKIFNSFLLFAITCQDSCKGCSFFNEITKVLESGNLWEKVVIKLIAKGIWNFCSQFNEQISRY